VGHYVAAPNGNEAMKPVAAAEETAARHSWRSRWATKL
jgi:hypothetical protein